MRLLLLFSVVLGENASESLFDTKRRDELGIVTETVTVPQWTPNGTVFVEKEKDVIRAKRPKPKLKGCNEESLFGLYDWDCVKGIRKLGYWSSKTQCKVYCLSSQLMIPKVKKIKCKCNKKSGACDWVTRVKGTGLVKNPEFKCVTTVNTAYWSQWTPWSPWTKCSRECGEGQRIRQRRRRCVNGVMGEHKNCPYQGHVQLDYDACQNHCANPAEVRVEFDDIKDKSFKVKWSTHNIDQQDIGHFLVEVWESVISWGQERYQIAKFDMINPKLRDIHVWREVKPLTRYDVWVWMKDSRGKPLTEPTIEKVTTLTSRFEYDDEVSCSVDFPTSQKDAMVTSCDHMTSVPMNHRCYTYCKDDWRKMGGSEYMVCMGGKWRGAWPKCEPRGWQCNFNQETYCPGCVRPENCCDHITNEGNIEYVCKKGYLMPASRMHNDKGFARVLMKTLTSDKASCMTFRPRRRDCSLTYHVKVIALYKKEGSKQTRERVLLDVAQDQDFMDKCRNDEDYEIEIFDVRPDKNFDTVQIVFEHLLDRHDASMGYDMWFDDFQHGYGRCSTMTCGEFPPPLLKGGGAAYGHDVALTNTCSDGDKAGSTCSMNCPDTHPVHHFAHYWQEIICQPSGFWNQPLYTYYTGYCQAPSCNFFDVVPPENGWYSCSDEGYEGSVCTFGCNSVDYELGKDDPYRIRCENAMWTPIGGKKKFVNEKVHAKCVFNHVFARRERKITQEINPLKAMNRQYRMLSGLDYPSDVRREQTNYNIELTRRKFGMDRNVNFQQVYHSVMNTVNFEENSEMFEMPGDLPK